MCPELGRSRSSSEAPCAAASPRWCAASSRNCRTSEVPYQALLILSRKCCQNRRCAIIRRRIRHQDPPHLQRDLVKKPSSLWKCSVLRIYSKREEKRKPVRGLQQDGQRQGSASRASCCCLWWSPSTTRLPPPVAAPLRRGTKQKARLTVPKL